MRGWEEAIGPRGSDAVIRDDIGERTYRANCRVLKLRVPPLVDWQWIGVHGIRWRRHGTALDRRVLSAEIPVVRND